MKQKQTVVKRFYKQNEHPSPKKRKHMAFLGEVIKDYFESFQSKLSWDFSSVSSSF